MRAVHLLIVPFLLASPCPRPLPRTPLAPAARPQHHQFDFWIGEWDVRTPDGKRGRKPIASPGILGRLRDSRKTGRGAGGNHRHEA